jgi:isocitrate dehydrogenase kinase/phosphatase
MTIIRIQKVIFVLYSDHETIINEQEKTISNLQRAIGELVARLEDSKEESKVDLELYENLYTKYVKLLDDKINGTQDNYEPFTY